MYVILILLVLPSITISNTTWLGAVSVNQNTSILYPNSHDGNNTFGFAPFCPAGYCKPAGQIGFSTLILNLNRYSGL